MLNISESHATVSPLVYTCYGLGSCVGVFISDRSGRMSGGAHIGLPSSVQGNDTLLSADAVLDQLLDALRILGSDLTSLKAKITGGAQVLSQCRGTGEDNIRSVQHYLVRNRILIAAEDTGGTFARTGKFDCRTGELFIRTSEGKRYTI